MRTVLNALGIALLLAGCGTAPPERLDTGDYPLTRPGPMTQPEQRLTLITLGVSDLAASTAFYRDVLGWTPVPMDTDQVTFFQLNGIILGLWPATELAADAGVDALEGGGITRVALAHNVRTREEVDEVLEHLASRGVRLLKPATDTPWGGRSGYFADPDGVLWEVAWNPGFPIDLDGNVTIPE